jgi:hypothetical protein
MYREDTQEALSTLKGTLEEQDFLLLRSLLAVKKGSATQTEISTASHMFKRMTGAVKVGCGQCLHCLRDGTSLGEDRTRMLVNRDMLKPQGRKGLGTMQDEEALLPKDNGCIMKMALLAFAAGKPGLVWRVGEETYVWHREYKGCPRGEWFKGKILAYDPIRIAHYLEFVRVNSDGSHECVHQYNGFVQLWRPDEYLSLSNPSA